MASNDEKNSDDLVSRRMNSGAHEPDAADGEVPPRGTSQGSDYFDDEETQSFEAFPDTGEAAADSDVPAGFSAEEWALINSPDPVKDDQPTQVIKTAAPASTRHGSSDLAPGGAGSADAGTRVSTASPEESRKAGAGKAAGARSGGYGFFDVIATLWTLIATPIVLMALAVRTIASGTFLKFEYFYRPGFPADTYGFSSDDRLHYASYAVDYLSNVDGSRYLGDIVLANGMRAFNDQELSHMADVKALISLLFFLGIVGVIGMVISGVYLSRKNGPGLHMGYRIGSLITLVLFIVIAIIAATGFDRFFTHFHQLFFSAGTWQFYTNDTLIRLFPESFWIDGGALGAGIVIIGALVLLWLSFIGRAKRKARKAERQAAKAADKKAAARAGE